MASEWEARGVPRALSVDMWWLASMTDRPEPDKVRRFAWNRDGAGRRLVALLALVALADALFYGHALGLSLAVFAAAVLAMAMLANPGQEKLRPALLLAFAALPVIEHLQALSVGFLVTGLLVSLVWAMQGRTALGQGVVRLVAALPVRAVRDGVAVGVDLAESGLWRDHRRHARAWVFPLGGALVLLALLAEANPILAEILARLLTFDAGGGDGLVRALFWGGAALMIWPLIAPQDKIAAASLPGLHLPGLSGGSVAKGLVLFNAILAIQTALDAAYLWGGASLPEGMTAAEYAHRGAYPLLVTALLAGGFALAARPFARENRRLRWLLLLWLGQNLLLTISALMRLELYIEAFGLTYLRLHSAIWMGLVAVGLGLVAFQVWRDLPNRWLLLRSVRLGLGVLYAACFVNFAAVIAAQNLSRDRFDMGYVCALGPNAAAAVAASGVVMFCTTGEPVTHGWRDWGFREWRVVRYLRRLEEAAP
jgi:hypothetical protein